MRTIDEPGRVCDMSDNSSFVVVHIFPFAFIEGKFQFSSSLFIFRLRMEKEAVSRM